MKTKIVVCTKGKHCRKNGGKEVYCALRKELEKQDLDDCVKLKKSECLGMCKNGPAVEIKGYNLAFKGLSPSKCSKIIKALAKGKKPLRELAAKK